MKKKFDKPKRDYTTLFKWLIRVIGILVILLGIGALGLFVYAFFLQKIGLLTLITPSILSLFAIISGIYLFLLSQLGRILLRGLYLIFFIYFWIWSTILTNRLTEETVGITLLIIAIYICAIVFLEILLSSRSAHNAFSKIPKAKSVPLDWGSPQEAPSAASAPNKE